MDDLRIKKAYRKLFESDPEYYGKMIKVFDKNMCWIGCQDSPQLFVYDFFCQLWSGNNSTVIEEDLIVSRLLQKILSNQLQYIIQETPQCFTDDDIENNQKLFKSYKESCFDLKVLDSDFWGGKQGEDGFIEFEEPIIKTQKRFPLEVGYVRPTQVEYHLIHRKCLARLPYNSDYIVYFEDVS